MSLAAGCPRCSTPVVEVPARSGTGWSCPEHGEISPLWRPARGDVRRRSPSTCSPRSASRRTCPWPMSPGLERHRLRASSATAAARRGDADLHLRDQRAGRAGRRGRGHRGGRDRAWAPAAPAPCTTTPGRELGDGPPDGAGAGREPAGPAVGGLAPAARAASSTARSSPARPAGAGCGSCCAPPRRCCCCATTGSCATSPRSGRRWSRCRSGARRPPGEAGPPTRLGCRGAHRPPHPLAGQRRHASRRRSWCARPRPPGSTSLALTDHDTAEGWAEADADRRARSGITLVRGMEISTRHDGRGVHLLAYLPDPTYPPLVAELRRILDGRSARLPAMLERLRELGIDDRRRRRTPRGRRHGRHRAPARRRRAGRARAWCADRDEAFARYLSPGRPAYVDRYAAPLDEMIAHRRRGRGRDRDRAPVGPARPRATPDEAALAGLAGLGLAGIEVDHQDHDAAEPASGCARSPATSAWSSPAPATTTAPARSTTSSAATPPPRRSTTGCSSRAAEARRRRRGVRCRRRLTPAAGRPAAERLLPPEPLEPLQHPGRAPAARPRAIALYARSGSRRPGPCRSRRAPSRPARRRRAT